MSAAKRHVVRASVIGLVALIGLGVWAYLDGRKEGAGRLLRAMGPRRNPSTNLPGDSRSRDQPGESQRRDEPIYFQFRAHKWAEDHSFNKDAILVWGGDDAEARGMLQNADISNIRPVDYVGADSCQDCHEENYEHWSSHPHRWMNAQATEETVRGDFSGSAEIRYRGGRAAFYRENGDYLMKLARGGVTRVFKINRTLGSRIQQYYIGTLQDGPERQDHPYRNEDHVLPFGFELTMRQWVPIVHANGQQGTDSARDDPFEMPSQLPYDTSCSMCHTTPPIGNLMLVKFSRFGSYSPRNIHFEGSNYLDESFPGAAHLTLKAGEQPTRAHLQSLTDQFRQLLREENTINLGISCEACHLGAKAHADDVDILPAFFPSGAYVHASGTSHAEIWGRTDANKNFICARCHSGPRPQFAAGMATWNSTEYTDAMRGHCYRPEKAEEAGMKSLTCVACHNPHKGIGRRWPKSSQADNASCTVCHERLADAVAAKVHTHHPIGSTGSECMNCHMPRINEGLGDMVRTHMIFSPTNVGMLEANQPNACNMCHVEKSIDWTLEYLAEWYGLTGTEQPRLARGGRKAYSQALIRKNYPNRSQPATLSWIGNSHSGTRMVATDVLIKAEARWALPRVLLSLHDPYMEIRQFTVQRLADYMGIHTEDYGYKHYMTADERREPLKRMIDELVVLPSTEQNQSRSAGRKR